MTVDAPSGPRNAVANPIINSPFLEPARHFDFTGASAKIVEKRRWAGYHGQMRTDRADGPVTQHELFPLPLVNDIRHRVNQWREHKYPNVTPTTRDLLDHWNRSDRRPLFFCQREAAETIIWLTEATAADRLFPQVLAIVEEFVAKRVKLSNDAPIEEIALATYRQPIIERLLAAIEPDTEMGEAAILPRIDRQRPFGTTSVVQFRTTKTARGTEKSHVSHVVLDSSWENMAAYHLERSPHVLTYVKNDHLDFELFYEFLGDPHRYIPDYLVRLAAGEREPVMLILEVKGLEDEQDRAKRAAAERWCKAVNNHGGLGVWDYYQTRKPGELRQLLEKFHERAVKGERITG